MNVHLATLHKLIKIHPIAFYNCLGTNIADMALNAHLSLTNQICFAIFAEGHQGIIPVNFGKKLTKWFRSCRFTKIVDNDSSQQLTLSSFSLCSGELTRALITLESCHC